MPKKAAPQYPQSVFPHNALRRVLGNLPAPHPQDVLDEVNAYHEDLWKDEPVPAPRYPTSRTLGQIKSILDADPATFQGARTQYASSDWVGPTEGHNLTELEIADALKWAIEHGYAVENANGSYTMTTEGLAALQA